MRITTLGQSDAPSSDRHQATCSDQPEFRERHVYQPRHTDNPEVSSHRGRHEEPNAEPERQQQLTQSSHGGVGSVVQKRGWSQPNA